MTFVILKFLVDIISFFAKLLEDTIKFEFKESQLIGDQEMLLEMQTLVADSFKCF